MKQFILLFLFAFIVNAKITVGINEFKPLVQGTEDKPFGFDIDIWEYIAKDINEDFEYKMIKGSKTNDVIPAAASGKIDVAISGITITSEREKIVDFSHPYMRSGLSILTKKKNISALSIIGTYIIASHDALLLFFTYLFICSFIIYMCERGRKSFNDNIISGMGEALYFVNTTTTSTGYGDFFPTSKLGRMFAVIIMWIGIGIIFPYVTGTMTNIISEKNKQTMTINDLRNKKVAVKSGTTSEDVIYKYGAEIYSYIDINNCVMSLKDDKVDAVVADMPLLQHIAKNDKELICNGLFEEQSYGIIVNNNDLRKKINVSLLKLLTNPDYNKIYNRWF